MRTRETKSKPLTLRMTPTEYAEIQSAAKRQQQSISQYVLDRILSHNGITLTQKREVYQRLLKIQDSAIWWDTSEKSENIVKECEQIWKCLQL